MHNVLISVFLPLWVTLLILVGKFTSILKSKRIILFLSLFSSLVGVVSSIFVFIIVLTTPNFVLENSYKFLSIKNVYFELGYYIDLISAFMLLILFIISTVVIYYAYYYMKSDKSFVRFFTYLNFFIFSMAGLLVSLNMFQLYIFWELVSISSYLLIAFWYKNNSSQLAGKKALIMNRIGDFALLLGIIYSSVLLFNFAPDTNFISIPFDRLDTISSLLYSYTSETSFRIICILILFGAIAKSAQFPLHTWIIDAMEGPTPISALIHSATMVAAGVFLIARLYPLFYQSEFIMKFIVIVGLITTILTAFSAITNDNIKRILAYSTSSQFGIMFIALGSGALTGSLLFLCSHAFIKSLLFLLAGLAIIAFGKSSNIFEMSGLRKQQPILAILFLIGALSLSGIMFSGFVSKSLIIHTLSTTLNYPLLIALGIVSFMTSFYIFRLYFLVFENNANCDFVGISNKNCYYVSIIPLALFIIILGFVFPTLASFKIDIIFVIIEILGFIFAYLIYEKKCIKFKLPILYKLSYNGFYLDNIYFSVSKMAYSLISKICDFIESYLYDGFVNFIVYITKIKSWYFSKMQTGNVQSYLCYSFLILATLFTLFCIIYSFVALFLEV